MSEAPHIIGRWWAEYVILRSNIQTATEASAVSIEIIECQSHTEREHVLAHEAGHAVAALDLSLSFEGTRLDVTKPDFARSARHEWGSLEVARDVLISFIADDPYSGLHEQMAGLAAEIACLGHHTGGDETDVNTWWTALGIHMADRTDERTREALGMSADDFEEDLNEWAHSSLNRLEAVSSLFDEAVSQQPEGAVVFVSRYAILAALDLV